MDTLSFALWLSFSYKFEVTRVTTYFSFNVTIERKFFPIIT